MKEFLPGSVENRKGHSENSVERVKLNENCDHKIFDQMGCVVTKPVFGVSNKGICKINLLSYRDKLEH